MKSFLCTLLLTLLATQANAFNFTASVDRTQLSELDSIELQLQSNDPTNFGNPDLAPLDKDFEILGRRQESRLNQVNGVTRIERIWHVSLQPRHSGTLEIPALQLGDLLSEPIRLEVVESDGSSPQIGAPLFIDASLDKPEVYVQAEAVLTLRLYHSVPLYNDGSLTRLQMDDARVEQLGSPSAYEKDIDGVHYGVIELSYAIFPQASGELRIPSQRFSATMAKPLDNTGGFAYGKPVRLKTPSLTLKVKPKPADYPTDAPWLPARALSLSEAWSPETTDVQVGESITRSLLLRVDGLSPAQLPPLPLLLPDDLRRYPEQPQLTSQATGKGLIGSREEREALVPVKAGTLSLPAVEVIWWNTEEDRLVRTNVPARTLTVSNNPALFVSPLTTAPLSASIDNTPHLWFWQLLSALLLCSNLLSFGLWLRARRQPAVPLVSQGGLNPRARLDDLKRACLANDPQRARQALDAWARQYPETLVDLARQYTTLGQALDGLNSVLYSPGEQTWEGKSLWRAVHKLPPASGDRSREESSPLPPLYPR